MAQDKIVPNNKNYIYYYKSNKTQEPSTNYIPGGDTYANALFSRVHSTSNNKMNEVKPRVVLSTVYA